MRRVFAVLTVLACVVVIGCASSRSQSVLDRPGSTLSATFADPHNTGDLTRGAGEPLLDRTELAPPARAVHQLAQFAQITDAHVRDAKSPARVPFLDRLGAPFESTFRPQETLTSQVLADTVAALDRVPLDAVVETGDLIDNAQQNELDAAVAALRGGRVDPGSGAPGYDGVQSASNPDPFYYRPDVDAPRHPGLLQQAERPFRSPGLRAPWYPLVGNHDLLVQGEFAPTASTNAVATGSRRLVALAPWLRPQEHAGVSPALVDRLLAHGLPGPTVDTAPDPRRRELSPAELVSELRAASGHGALVGDRLDYSFDIGGAVRAIVLDTVRRDEGSQGLVEPAQVGWLAAELRAAGDRPVILLTHQPVPGDAGGDAVLGLLDHDPHVIAAISGDTHRNELTPRRTPAGGYWLISTSSLVDYPQQARVVRVVETADGRIALETWMIDHDNAYGGSVSRELAYLDAQGGRPQSFAGSPLDRNATLYLPQRR